MASKQFFKHKIITFLVFLLFLILLMQSSANNNKDVNMKFDKYENEWVKVDEMEKKGLTKSALDIVDKIFEKAKKDNNINQFIKATMYRLKYLSNIEEDAVIKIITELENEIKSSPSPLKELLNSILAEIYWQYYIQKRFQIMNRSVTAEIDETDIKTWDIKKFMDKITILYLDSLKNSNISKSLDINIFEDFLTFYYNTKDLVPTLYDLLAHRALLFFTSDETLLTKPSYAFILKDPKLFSQSGDFTGLDIKAEDTDSLKYKALIIMQDLIKFHKDDENAKVLVDIDIQRLYYIWDNHVDENKDTLFINALTGLYDKYKNDPSSVIISYHIASYYNNEGDKYNPEFSDDYKWLKKKAHDILLNIIKNENKYDPNTIGFYNCKALKSQIEKKELNITTEKIVIPDKPSLSLVKYKNVFKTYFRIIKLTEGQKRTAKKKSNKNYDDLYKYYKSFKPAAEWEQNLPPDEDYNTHAVEIKIPALQPGYYIILTGSDKDFSLEKNTIGYEELRVSNISYINRLNRNTGNIDIYVFNRDTGAPLNSVKADIYQEKYNYTLREYVAEKKESYTTDDNGYFKIKPDNRSIKIAFSKDDDTLFLDDYIYQNTPYKYNVNPIKVFFFTDRSIYRPGQTIYYKGIVIDTSNEQNRIVPDYNTTIYFYDVNWQEITKQTVTANKYGTFNGTFTAPVDRLNGNMCIKTFDATGQTYVSVEEYKRPKFEVEFDPLKGSYKLGEKIDIMGFAKSFAGSNIDNADVKYRVVRNTYFPYWYWYWGVYPQTKETEIINGTSITDNQGKFTVTFNALPDLSIAKDKMPVFNYSIYVDVTDINGETHSSNITVNIGYTALTISLLMNDMINSNRDNNFKIISNNLNGEYEASVGKIEIYRLKSSGQYYKKRLWQKPDKFILNKDQFKNDFPYDQYDDENNFYKWDKIDKVYAGEYNTEKSKELAIKNLTGWDQGKYILELTTKDKFNKEIKYYKYFTLFSEKEKDMPLNDISMYSPVKTNCLPGENAVVGIGSSADGVSVLYEVEHKNKITKKSIIKLSGENKFLKIPVTEEYRGNFIIHLSFVKHNRFFSYSQNIYVPWSNKDLKIEFMSFRNKLKPGENEEWKIKITGSNKDKIAAEMVAALYDASLDQFRYHSWYFNIYPYYYTNLSLNGYYSFNTMSSHFYEKDWNEYFYIQDYYYTNINWFNGYYFDENRLYKGSDKFSGNKRKLAFKDGVNEEEFDDAIVEKKEAEESTIMKEDAPEKPKSENNINKIEENTQSTAETKTKSMDNVQIRKNFNETAFFYPDLETNEDGEIIISFTIPEALTRWKMLGFAHTKNLEYGLIENELVTQKELMVMPNIPRFLRQGDTIELVSKISNLSDNNLSGNAVLKLFDASTMKPVDKILNNVNSQKAFKVKKGESTKVTWKIKIPDSVQALTYRVIAKAGNYSDGEESSLPVLTNRMLVTESLPLSIRGKGTKKYSFTKLINSKSSKTLKHEKLTLEFTSNPIWYAIQAIPYLIEYPYECSEQVFSRLYANSIATDIINSNPKIKKVFDQWRNTDALLSNLQKNEELKSLLLEETPWVLEGKSESERKKRIAILFDLNYMSQNLNRNILKLKLMQAPNGGFPWFPGLPDDRYITQHIIAGLGKLINIEIKSVKNNSTINAMTAGGIRYLDDRMREDYEYLLKHNIDLNKDNISYIQIHYLYARSFFNTVPVESKNKKAFDYWMKQAKDYWVNKGNYMKGMISITFNRYNEKDTAVDIIKSLKENSIENEEMGMYWKNNIYGWYWYQAPIETQSLLIEAFTEVVNDTESVNSMKVWLLKNKQVQDWKTTKATVDACYALLLRGSDWLSSDENIEIQLGDIKIRQDNIKDAEAGTGHFKITWQKNEIKENMGNISVTKNNDGVSWGALYWQYFEDLDKITPHETPLKLKKELFLEVYTDKGPVIKPIKNNALKPGDLIKVRIILSVDRDMEYVHMKDMRASGLEPINVLSTYKYQDGLWYYESTKDASTNFFFPRLNKGTYVFEYPLRVTHKGDFSNGITSIQSMYAPEFTSHSEGIRIEVK